VVEEYSPKCW